MERGCRSRVFEARANDSMQRYLCMDSFALNGNLRIIGCEENIWTCEENYRTGGCCNLYSLLNVVTVIESRMIRYVEVTTLYA